MKRRMALSAAAALLAVTLCACAGQAEITENGGDAAAGEKDLKIVATIFPEYDWVREVLGEKAADAELTMLLDSGVDLHSYQPTAADIMKISNCDMFICVGGKSDAWAEDALKESVNPDMKVLKLLEILGGRVREEELVEGMEAGHDDEEEETEIDEHVWLSLRNAEFLTEEIADALAEIDPADADIYHANADAYREKLGALDEQYRACAENAAVKTLLFGDRFPFRYMTDDYGLDYYAAFAGCSAETEAGFETITFLAKKIDELELPCVMTIEGTDHRIAETVANNTSAKNQKILVLDSMQSVTMKDVEAGASYLGIMEKNLEVLREALGTK